MRSTHGLKAIKAIMERIVKRMEGTVKKTAFTIAMALYYVMCAAMPTYASGFGNGIQTLNNSLMDVIALAGVGIIIWGGWEMAKAMGERDSAGKVHALEIIIGGLIAIGIRTFVSLFGG